MFNTFIASFDSILDFDISTHFFYSNRDTSSIFTSKPLNFDKTALRAKTFDFDIAILDKSQRDLALSTPLLFYSTAGTLKGISSILSIIVDNSVIYTKSNNPSLNDFEFSLAISPKVDDIFDASLVEKSNFLVQNHKSLRDDYKGIGLAIQSKLKANIATAIRYKI